MNEKEATILLNMVPEVGPLRFQHLKNRFPDLKEVFNASIPELKSVEEISEIIAKTILAFGNEKAKLVNELTLAKENGVTILTLADALYPPFLKSLHDPPPVLYCKGDCNLLSLPSIALVGSRRPTLYGERVTRQLSGELASSGMVIVSGLARGIDTIAHCGTLAVKGKTVAVLGSGILKLYPPENKKLAESIAEQGLLLSEFPLHFPPEPGNFPRRNRIIAGLSLGTVVIEADEKSGALITAHLACEQGKDVFAVPGPIHSARSRGPHRLIRQGAKLVENSNDILDELEPLRQRLFPQLTKKSVQKSKGISYPKSPVLQAQLSQCEEQLLTYIDFEPVHIDLLSSRSHFSSGELSQALLQLELKGIVKSLAGKMYVKN